MAAYHCCGPLYIHARPRPARNRQPPCAHRRCQIDSPVRSHARLLRQHSCDLPMDRVRDCRSGWGWLVALCARTLRAAHGMVRRMRRLRVCEACDRGADREICAAHAIRAEKVAISAREHCMAVRGHPWMKRYHRTCTELTYACIPVSRSKSTFYGSRLFPECAAPYYKESILLCIYLCALGGSLTFQVPLP